MDQELARLADSKYVLVTTFRKDGSKVATPVWSARDGDELIFWTRSDSWKVKRLSRNQNVELAECDVRGKPKASRSRVRPVCSTRPRPTGCAA